jgi:polysaccharide export outer membrane protein
MTICKRIYYNIFFALAVSLLLFSCRTTKPVQYLQGPIDTASLSRITLPEPLIQKGDLIGITVYSDNPQATAIFNQQMNTNLLSNATSGAGTDGATITTGTASQSMPGYLVDANGNIRFQLLGELYVEGLTKAGLESLLKEKLSGKYLSNPYCNIRFLNYKFTILGEVGRQGVYAIPGERISILEGLGMAGDISLYGLKDSIMVVRETNGKRSFGYLDVSKPEIFTSPYYYLQQNDIVIVKTNPKKPDVSEATASRNLARAATITSILASISIILLRLFP